MKQYDFRDYRSTVKDAVEAVNQNADWKWTARVNKNEIKLTNGYIEGEYSGDFNDYFSIKAHEFPGGDIEFETRDCLGTYAGGAIPHVDGTIEQCIGMAVRDANRYFESRY